MQVLKPQALGLSTRPIEYRKRFGLSVSAYLHLPFAQGERGCLWAEQSMWSFLSKEMTQPLIDEGVAKVTPEFLVHGRAHPPKDRPNACAVRARFAGKEKTLLVFGERYWDDGKPTAPQPFESLPLGWSAAYGGADFPLNGVGRGRQAKDGVVWLPNIELPSDRLLRPDQAIAPAGFGSLDLMHPQRAKYRGTYDADYLKQHAPGFAPDTDWRHFNLAPADQWLDGQLEGNEAFSFENMHPTKPFIEGCLPGMRARVFVGYRMEGAEPKIREVPLRLTTVWFFPHAERCIAIFQGLAEVGTDDGSDVISLMGAVERMGEVRADQHYLDAAAKRADPKMGPIYSIIDSDLLPQGVSTFDPDVEDAKKPFEMAGLQGEAQYRRAQLDVEIARQKAIAMGKDPDALGIRMPVREKVPQGDELPPYLEQKMKEMEAQKWASIEDAVTLLERAYAVPQKATESARLAHRGPPRYRARAHLEEMRALVAMGSRKVDLEPLLPKLYQLEDTHRQGYLQMAHVQLPAFAMPAAEATRLRGEMARAVPLGIRFFAGIDFTGADLSGLDLREANFEGAWLESVNLCNANLSGADFSGAVLAHANLEGVIAIGTKFRKANLGKARLAGGVFDGADFSEAMLMHCAFAGTQMRRAIFAKTNLLETTWGRADWEGAQLAGQTFYKVDLKGMRFPGADLSACNFLESDLSGVDMQAAKIELATFATCRLDGANLKMAQCAGTVAVKDSSLTGADLSGANLRTFNFGASDMRGAKLFRATLDGANLCDARMDEVDMRLSSAKGVLMRKARCANALLSGVNFSDAVMQKADLRGADLRRSNLFGADLSRVRLDGSTQFEGALLKRARTWPRLTPEQQAAP
ncbi:DUF2169 family type VI secretion system accessory protein [Variovorax paradoxus]|uniref:DUF2169 family type VI secretion system accessory protein n=1 Tax=Variovorax paradoxus TaxID=34073 RepID=UPI002781C72C|nr:DUF2169 domain-containing protein [Variovorax paradoxus]MDQ0588981.1 uncharacterized protein YjbI with pentapeptide repeats [Variovorax paradoxus]